jgi:hypothetical protein
VPAIVQKDLDMLSRSKLSLACAVWVCVLGGCMIDSSDDEEEMDYVDPGIGTADGKFDGASSVGAVVDITCSTIPVRGLSIQIVEELRCLAPGALVPFEPSDSVTFGSGAVLPYLETDTEEALRSAAPDVGTITVNSGLRSLAQQFLLYRWWQDGRCGIRAAARPGRSNHETGRAVDVQNRAQARSALYHWGFTSLANDPVHFEHLDSPDLRELGVLAFQRLWNRAHPEDMIADDGVYGPQTAARLERAPSGGFSVKGCSN